MPVFRTQYDAHDRVYHHGGSPVKDVYSASYSSFGALILTVTGQEDLYGYIQSHKDNCDLHLMLERYANGETDALSKVQGWYGDITGMPKTYAEVLNAVLAGESMFDKLPVEVKQQFDNSFAVWLTAMDRPDFAERMGFAPSPAPTEVHDSELRSPDPVPAPTPSDSSSGGVIIE